MKKTSTGLTVRILEKEYQIACREDEREGLIKATHYLEDKLKEIADQGKIIGSERAAIMAALNISYEMMQSKGSAVAQSGHQKRLDKLRKEVGNVVDKYRQAAL